MNPPADPAATVRLFVYGTLKQGFPNHHHNRGRRLPGEFRTRLAHPMWVVRLPNEDRAPWLMDQPGQGLQVTGQVYEVTAAELPALDRLEEVGQPSGYVRVAIELEPADGDGQAFCAQAYLKPASQLPQCLQREGPYADYTLVLAEGYWLVQD
ncbi:MAG: gamma-glutamylcyclotransferase [Burkholderiaceae bacterium]|nr:gamma-glutamylcyclotransferase [Burkholderiaceae bacterium]